MQNKKISLVLLTIALATACENGNPVELSPQRTEATATPSMTDFAPNASESQTESDAAANFTDGLSMNAVASVSNPSSNRNAFVASGVITHNYGFEGITSGFAFPGNNWNVGGVTYTTPSNIVVGTASGYNPPSAVLCYNFWSPMSGNVSAGFNMLGFDVGMLGNVSPVNVTITTNVSTYTFTVNFAHWTNGGGFFGFTAPNAGEQVKSFLLASHQGGGSAPCLDNVVLGNSDATAPVITPNVVGTAGDNGWYVSDVAVSWTVVDLESSFTSTGCAASAVTTDTNGASFTCSATSLGGTSSSTVVVKRDATAPGVAFSGNAGSYTVDQQVTITCAASDATSGLAASTCPQVDAPAYTLALGSHTLNASATDNAGNDGAASATFTVSVTEASLCALVRQWVSQHGIANSMCQQIGRAPVHAFVNHVNAQRGKAVSSAHADILIALRQAF